MNFFKRWRSAMREAKKLKEAAAVAADAETKRQIALRLLETKEELEPLGFVFANSFFFVGRPHLRTPTGYILAVAPNKEVMQIRVHKEGAYSLKKDFSV